MAKIIRGTTPTLKYTFSTISVADITAAYLTIKQAGEVIIEKNISTATIGDFDISWTLTQAETLMLVDNITVMCNWLLSDGTRGATARTKIAIEVNDKEEVI